MMTATEYIESLRKLKTRVYMFGEKIDNYGIGNGISIILFVNILSSVYPMAYQFYATNKGWI